MNGNTYPEWSLRLGSKLQVTWLQAIKQMAIPHRKQETLSDYSIICDPIACFLNENSLYLPDFKAIQR